MTVIPVLSLRAASKCNATDDFFAFFGWDGEAGTRYCTVTARWTFVKNLWVASVELPFYWFSNASGQFARFKDEYINATGGKGCINKWWDEGATVQPCPATDSIPDYGAFNEVGIQCDWPGHQPQVNQSG
eukprot:CAMPEP_0180798874 /NCGR_PEP_ID=MMETSP1038_2-20121128/58211_1 /TAXON_ID=632150 /ORGANISM="Azadinium spinosum, Strain 3D9" /LENGTH=129 /DNA_ID=CAMNT_0022838381 /DNA_START=12 /DNA_END=398 /DNA_ORIENTATION=+